MNSDIGNGRANEQNQFSPVTKKMKRHTAASFDYTEIERMLPENFDDLYRTFPLTEDTTCGLGFLKGDLLQKLANKKTYVFLYGIIGCVFSATYAYFNGTITTLEKRYKIPSRNTGIISVGNDLSQLLVSAVLSYYAGKGHRPRWMAFGLITIVIFCLMNIFPHFLYGPGADALALTVEFGGKLDANSSLEVLENEKRKTLCNLNGNSTAQCETGEGNYAPQVILFIAQFVSGIGQPLYYTLGVAYMDDNIQKSKTPTFISFSYFIRMLGPAIGYTLASICLKFYISPSLTPTIDNLDPRWLGAWWLGWFILAILMTLLSVLLAMFPKQLPRAAVRRVIQNEKIRRELAIVQPEVAQASLKDMFKTFKRLLRNTTFMLNNIASFFYIFGYIPYWTFTPKYIETQYRQTASISSLVTGTVALVFSAIGVLLPGFLISKYRPSARKMAGWNVFVSLCTIFGIISYIYLGCADNERAVVLDYPLKPSTDADSLPVVCNADCSCDYVKFSPVCGENRITYISACHAGCKEQTMNNGNKIYSNCSCIESGRRSNFSNSSAAADNSPFAALSEYNLNEIENEYLGGNAIPGSCPVNCMNEFYAFLAVMCLLKLIGASGRSTNFLIGVRCVEEHDKTVALGVGLALMGFAFIPSPIFFGMILDSACIVWGKTCAGTGNCWLYDGEVLRLTLNVIAAIFITFGMLFDCGVWYYVKDLKIFDDEEPKDVHLVQTKSTENTDSPPADSSIDKTATD